MDWKQAIADGYSPDEVMAELGKRSGMDYKAAIADGYTPEEVMGELDKRIKTPSKPAVSGVTKDNYADKATQVGPGQFVGMDKAQHRAEMKKFLATQGKRSAKQELLRGLPMGNRVADAALGTYNDPVHPERTVDTVLGPDTSPTMTGALVKGVGKMLSNPAPQIEGLIAAPADIAVGAGKALLDPTSQQAQNYGPELAKGLLAPTGLVDMYHGDMSFPEARNAWENNMMGSALATTGSLKMAQGLGKGTKFVAGKAVDTALSAIPESVINPKGMARSALKPYNGESVTRMRNVDKGLDTILKADTASPAKLFQKNLMELEEIAGRQDVLLNTKGETSVPLQPLYDALQRSRNEAIQTPGMSEAKLSAIDKVLKDVEANPRYADGTMPLAEIQTLKKNIWKELRDNNVFNKDATPGLADAMWDTANGLNDIVIKYIPEMAKENARYGEIANSNQVLMRAVKRLENRNLISLGTLLQIGSGHWGGLARAALVHAVEQPTFKIYVAQKIAKAKGRTTPAEINQVTEAIINDIKTTYDPSTGRQIPAEGQGVPTGGAVANPTVPMTSDISTGRNLPQQQSNVPVERGVAPPQTIPQGSRIKPNANLISVDPNAAPRVLSAKERLALMNQASIM